MPVSFSKTFEARFPGTNGERFRGEPGAGPGLLVYSAVSRHPLLYKCVGLARCFWAEIRNSCLLTGQGLRVRAQLARDGIYRIEFCVAVAGVVLADPLRQGLPLGIKHTPLFSATAARY